MNVRLQKYLADCGIASRRKCEELIVQGKIEVNGIIVTELGTKIDDQKDKVKYNGNIVEKKNEDYIYILLNKPIDYVTTVSDQFNRNIVLDLVNIKNRRLVPVRKARYVYIWSINFNR